MSLKCNWLMIVFTDRSNSVPVDGYSASRYEIVMLYAVATPEISVHFVERRFRDFITQRRIFFEFDYDFHGIPFSLFERLRVSAGKYNALRQDTLEYLLPEGSPVPDSPRRHKLFDDVHHKAEIE